MKENKMHNDMSSSNLSSVFFYEKSHTKLPSHLFKKENEGLGGFSNNFA